jgi:hypothetical protein
VDATSLGRLMEATAPPGGSLPDKVDVVPSLADESLTSDSLSVNDVLLDGVYGELERERSKVRELRNEIRILRVQRDTYQRQRDDANAALAQMDESGVSL